MSSTLGSSTSTGWNRRSSAGSFSMFARYSSSVVAPIARSSPRASIGFSMLPASIAPSAAPAPTIVCSSSMNVMTSPSLSTISFRTAFKRSSNSPRYFEPGDHRAQVQRDHALVLQRLGHVARHDPLRQSLDDRGLAHAGLADQDRVVLRAAGQHLDHAAHLFVAADHRVELALPRLLGEVAAVALERLVLLLGVLVGDALTPAHLGERRQHTVARQPGVLQDPRRARVDVEQRQQQVLGRDVLVGERLGLLARPVQHLPGRRGDPDVGRLTLRVHLGDPIERLVDLVAHRLRRHADLVQQRVDHALGIGEQRERHVLRLDRLVVARHRLLMGAFQRRL